MRLQDGSPMFVVMHNGDTCGVYNTTNSECISGDLTYEEAWDLKYSLDDEHYFTALEKWEKEGGDKPEHDSASFTAGVTIPKG